MIRMMNSDGVVERCGDGGTGAGGGGASCVGVTMLHLLLVAAAVVSVLVEREWRGGEVERRKWKSNRKTKQEEEQK
jgi:hypothetical protein